MNCLTKSLSLFLFVFVFGTACSLAVHSDSVATNWKEEIPLPVHPNKEFLELYEKTWEIAAGRVRKGPEGLPASPYMDENCYDSDIWIWDTCFMSLFSKYAPKSFPGMESLDNFYIPIHENRKAGLNIHLRDNPPLFAWAELDHYLFNADKKRIQRIFNDKQYLQKHFAWFNTVEKGSKQPCSHQGIFLGRVGDKGFTWTGGASGMDNTPRGRDCGGYGKIMWVDAISQQAMSALYISALYKLQGKSKEAAQWNKSYETLKKTINDLYWNEEDGFYYDVCIESGKHSKVKTLASLWPLMARVATREQAEKVVKHLENPKEFGGDFPWPTLSRDDQDYNDETGDYWKGGIWLPLAYMGTKALENYGYHDLANEYAEKLLLQQLRTYQEVTPHTIWECYSPSRNIPSTEHGRRARPDFCGWSALGPISLFIENVLGFHKINALGKEVHWNLREKNGKHGIRRLTFGDITADIVFDGKNSVSVNTNKTFSLIINGKKYSAPPGNSIFKVKPLPKAQSSIL